MFAKVALLSALVSSAFATVFITSPTSSSTFTGGQTATISWIDDGKSPSLSQWSNASIAIYAGNANQQTLLQMVAPSVNVSTTSSINFTPSPSIGPNGQEYFIRMQSLTFMQGQYPVMAFSALYNMASMTGTFNASVSAEINGQSTAPIGGTTSASGSASSAAATGSTASSTSSHAVAAASASSTSTTAAASSNGALGSSVASIWISAIFGAVVLVLML